MEHGQDTDLLVSQDSWSWEAYEKMNKCLESAFDVVKC